MSENVSFGRISANLPISRSARFTQVRGASPCIRLRFPRGSLLLSARVAQKLVDEVTLTVDVGVAIISEGSRELELCSLPVWAGVSHRIFPDALFPDQDDPNRRTDLSASEQFFGNAEDWEHPRAWRCPRMPPADHFTSTSIRIHGWMQHSNRCFPFDRPVISRWLP